LSVPSHRSSEKNRRTNHQRRRMDRLHTHTHFRIPQHAPDYSPASASPGSLPNHTNFRVAPHAQGTRQNLIHNQQRTCQ